jgi:hypothetical protein
MCIHCMDSLSDHIQYSQPCNHALPPLVSSLAICCLCRVVMVVPLRSKDAGYRMALAA